MSMAEPLTLHDVIPEPLGYLQLFGPLESTPVLVWECPSCSSIVTDLEHHNEKVH
jgi:hypothetical protein